MITVMKMSKKTRKTTVPAASSKRKIHKKGYCPVCGMDVWCGTDGCPLDPQ